MPGKSRPPFVIRRTLAAAAFLLGAAVVASILYFTRSEWVEAGSVGVWYGYGGLVRSHVVTPRRVWIPWGSHLYTYPTTQQLALYTDDPQSGEVRDADSIQVTTNDNMSTAFDVAVWYHIERGDVFRIFDNFRGVDIKQIQSNYLRPTVKRAVQDVGTQYSAIELMTGARKQASASLRARLADLVGQKGITVDFAEFAGVHPNEQTKGNTLARVNALVDLGISRTANQKAKIERDIAITKAKAEAQAQALTAQQVKGESIELQRLEAQIAATRKWDGQVPPIMVRPGQSVTITPGMLDAGRDRPQAGGGQ